MLHLSHCPSSSLRCCSHGTAAATLQTLPPVIVTSGTSIVCVCLLFPAVRGTRNTAVSSAEPQFKSGSIGSALGIPWVYPRRTQGEVNSPLATHTPSELQKQPRSHGIQSATAAAQQQPPFKLPSSSQPRCFLVCTQYTAGGIQL